MAGPARHGCVCVCVCVRGRGGALAARLASALLSSSRLTALTRPLCETMMSPVRSYCRARRCGAVRRAQGEMGHGMEARGDGRGGGWARGDGDAGWRRCGHECRKGGGADMRRAVGSSDSDGGLGRELGQRTAGPLDCCSGQTDGQCAQRGRGASSCRRKWRMPASWWFRSERRGGDSRLPVEARQGERGGVGALLVCEHTRETPDSDGARLRAARMVWRATWRRAARGTAGGCRFALIPSRSQDRASVLDSERMNQCCRRGPRGSMAVAAVMRPNRSSGRDVLQVFLWTCCSRRNKCVAAMMQKSCGCITVKAVSLLRY